MAPKKNAEDKVKEGQTLTIDVDSFVRTRDSVVTGLATLQDAIQTLSTAYIKHTNAVLGEHGAGLDVETALSKLGNNPLLGSLQLGRAASPAKSNADAAGEKKERKRRQHDPNAPKRPLTPFFLYMQTARPIIANDLGADVAKGAVSIEGTRRWSTMDAADKQLWTNAYKENLRLYNARMHSYKVGGNTNAKDMDDTAAIAYADRNNIVSADNSADAQLVGEASATLLDDDADGEPEKEPTPPPKTTPKGKGGRKGKATKSTPSVPETIVPPAPVVPAKEAEKEKSPEKKRKRPGKKSEEIAEPEEAPVETPKSGAKPRKKKAKSDA